MTDVTSYLIEVGFWDRVNIIKLAPLSFESILEAIEIIVLEADMMLDIRYDLRNLC
jgi:hypothetical protein